MGFLLKEPKGPKMEGRIVKGLEEEHEAQAKVRRLNNQDTVQSKGTELRCHLEWQWKEKMKQTTPFFHAPSKRWFWKSLSELKSKRFHQSEPFLVSKYLCSFLNSHPCSQRSLHAISHLGFQGGWKFSFPWDVSDLYAMHISISWVILNAACDRHSIV